MEQRIGIERMEEAVNLFGSFDENIRLLEAEFQVQAVNRGGEIVVSGEPENVMLAAVLAEGRTVLHNAAREPEICDLAAFLRTCGADIAGDGENTPEMKALHGIDIAFLPVNQPYTMTVDQAVDAVKAIRPAIFYPYHYGEVEEKTDIDRLSRELTDITEIRIRPMG